MSTIPPSATHGRDATDESLPSKPSETMTEAEKAAYWFDLYLEETTWRRKLGHQLAAMEKLNQLHVQQLNERSARSETGEKPPVACEAWLVTHSVNDKFADRYIFGNEDVRKADLLVKELTENGWPNVEKIPLYKLLSVPSARVPRLKREAIVQRRVWGPDDDYRVIELQVDGADLKTGDRVTVEVYRE